jgi:hypothetical protein
MIDPFEKVQYICMVYYKSRSVNQGYGYADPDTKEKIMDQKYYRYLSLLFYFCL